MRKTNFLIDQVTLTPHFQRSINIAIDLNKEDVLDGYVLQPTAIAVLENLANSLLHSKQSAFTWTGPYGSGKSSLALLLSSLTSKNSKLKQHAQEILQLREDSNTVKVFSKKWEFLPITGSRRSVIDLIYESAPIYLKGFTKTPGRRSDKILDLLDQYAKSKKCQVLLVIDEMGKILEHMSQNGEDIHFFQELAERTRDHQRIVTIGILHQNFEQYAQRLSKELRDEWMKVQGRYVDLPLITTNDETITLVSRAISANYPHPKTSKLAQVIYESIKNRRPNISDDLQKTLDKCWPLHPIVAAILGPASRKRYGQNQRSLFAFLSSVEAKGFKEFLEHTKFTEESCFGPAEYLDYLNLNLSAAIQGSPDSRLWSLICTALERANRFSHKHQRLLKSIAVLELFKENSGLLPTNEVLETLNIAPREEFAKLLENLAQASIIVFRRHVNSWALYAGSDFDIESSLEEAKAEIGDPSAEILSNLIDPAPVIAKEHYWNSGCLRWFTKQVLSISGVKKRQGIKIDDGSGGVFILVLPDELTGSRDFERVLATESKLIASEDQFKHVGIVLGAAKPEIATTILRETQELAALQLLLETRAELEGDLVARQEIKGRIDTAQLTLESHLEAAMLEAGWTYAGEKPKAFDRKTGLGIVASRVASEIYKHCPKFDNEILNRQSISSSATKARKDLLYSMLQFEHKENLGYTGFSADAGLYGSILKGRLHTKFGEQYRFVCDSSKDDNLGRLWRETERVIDGASGEISLEQIYQVWQAPPFGLRRGIMPVLFFCFFLSNREKYAIYSNSIFISKITELYIDELLRFPEQFSLRAIRLTKDQERLLSVLSQKLTHGQKGLFSDSPLEVARGLVARILRLPDWARRTSELSPDTVRVRAVLLAASDPHALLFHDLPNALKTKDSEEVLNVLTRAMRELEEALPNKLEQMVNLVKTALDPTNGDLKSIGKRALKINDQSGDPDVNGFIAKLINFDFSVEQSLRLVSAAARKQANDLTDLDLKTAENQLLTWCMEFKKLELLSTIKDHDTEKYLINIAYGLSDSGERSVLQFSVSESSKKAAEQHARKLISLLGSLDRETQLATLVHTSQLLIGPEK